MEKSAILHHITLNPWSCNMPFCPDLQKGQQINTTLTSLWADYLADSI